MYTIISNTLELTFDNTKTTELLLNKIKNLIHSFTKQLMKKVKVEKMSIKSYSNISKIINQYISMLDNELGIKFDSLNKELVEMHNGYLTSYAESKIKALQESLDEEKWEVVEVPLSYNALIERLHNSDAVIKPSSGFTKQLISDDIPYWATKSLLVLLVSICEYSDMMIQVNEITFNIFCNLIELIKVFLDNHLEI